MLTKNDIKQIDTVVTKRIKNEIAPVKKDITSIRKRVESIEDHLSLPPI